MKILQVIDRLNVGGAERVLVDLTNILFEKGHAVDVLTLVCPGPLASQLNPGIRLINLDRKNKFSVKKLKEANNICRNYDVVHTHLRYNFRYLSLARMLYGGHHALLLHDHYGDIENDESIPFAIRHFARRNKWFIGVSASLTKWAVNKLGLARENVLLLPNIVVKRGQSGQQSPVGEDSVIRILHVSNFREAKHHIFAIKLIAALRKHLPVRVLFVGQVVDPEYFRKLDELIENHGIRDVVTVVHECHDVQSLMADFHMGLHTAYQESGPLILIEYLAQRLPFLAYKTGQVSLQISSVFPEFFMSDFEIDTWIHRIIHIMEKRSEYVEKMSGVFDRMYSADDYYKKCIGFYHRIMDYGA
jgi:glycosyltransferase involved in cell wall biosynthesis